MLELLLEVVGAGVLELLLDVVGAGVLELLLVVPSTFSYSMTGACSICAL